MSPLERHVAAVRSREGTTRALRAVARGATVVAAGSVVAILLEKFLLWQPGRESYIWLAGHPLVALGAAATVAAIAGVVVGIMRRPSREQAAVRIDEALGTKEKFSTALYLQSNPDLASDPFVRATVVDAITTADRVNLAGRFPIQFPRSFGIAVAIALLAFGLSHLRTYDLFGGQARAALAQVEAEKQEVAKKQVEEVLAQINTASAEIQAEDEIRLAKQHLQELTASGMNDASAAERTAAKAQQALDAAKAQQDRIRNAAAQAQAKNNQKTLASLDAPKDNSRVSDIQKDLRSGDMDSAMDKMNELASEFEQMDKENQAKAAQQMQSLANQMQQAIQQNPQVQQAAQQLAQQSGLSQQQVQQLQQQMQQAAQSSQSGNQQASQQQQQQAQQQLQQQMQQAGASQQQIQQAQQLAQQMQGIQMSQSLMQQLQQAAQKTAQTMQQQSQQQQNQQSQKSSQQSSQQSNSQSGMGQCNSQMQQAMQNIKQSQQGGQKPGGEQQGTSQGNSNQSSGQQSSQGGKPSQGRSQGGSQSGSGVGSSAGPAGGTGEAPNIPFDFRQDLVQSQSNENGQVIAQSLVKTDAERGESTAQLREVVRSNLQEATDEVDNQRISRQAQKAVKDYFSGITGQTDPAKPEPEPAK